MAMEQKLKLLADGINTQGILWKLRSNPQLWNTHTARTESEDSPHYGLDDIWVRFGDESCAVTGEEHDSYWYDAEDILNTKDFCLDIMRVVGGVELGGVLITRIPPGATCKPHTDPGWHARRYDKFAIQITSAPGQKFHFEDVSIESKPGDLYWFDNQYLHWVTNPTEYERITMIVCIRLDKGATCLGQQQQ